MLVESVHVQLAYGRINDSVYLKNRVFTFRVAKKIEKRFKKKDYVTISEEESTVTSEKNLIGTDDTRKHGKGLTANKSGYWRYRVGAYRILADIR